MTAQKARRSDRTQKVPERTGIRYVHGRNCGWLSYGPCDCTPTYQALGGHVWHGDKSKLRRKHRKTLEEAEAWRAQAQAECKRERERQRRFRQQRMASVRIATERAAQLAAEKRAATQEAQIAAVRAERQRMARLIRQLPPDLRGVERLYGHIRKGCQDAERAELAADGMLRMRLRAIYQSFREAEETLKVALAER